MKVDVRHPFLVTGGTRVLLWTDTLADVNGPSRFIQNMADCAHASGRDLTVFTSTRKPHASRPNVVNFAPGAAMAMPGYPVLDLVLPPLTAMVRAARRAEPDVMHISTPGPVGFVGVMAAKIMGIPLAGVYHTDFPSYVQRLFEDGVLTRIARACMYMFYGGFGKLFVRSDEYARHVRELALAHCDIERLRPGVDLSSFGTRFRDPSVWQEGVHARPGGEAPVRVLYCGRVSVEKNLDLLARIWPRVVKRVHAAGREVELVVVGDGPLREDLEGACRGTSVRFLGFRFAEELSRLYASSDLFVFPSVTDTLGQVVLEAQASGLAAIVSDVGGPKEVVRHGVTGLVTPHGSDEAWIGAITELVLDDQRRALMGRAAAAAMEACSIQDSFEHFWGVHETLAHRHKGAVNWPCRG